MNKQEAKSIATAELQTFRMKPYKELVKMIDSDPIVFEKTGQSGTQYQLEIEAFWDSRKGEDVRITALIDDKGWRAFVPMTFDFIKSKDDSFVGE